MIFGEIRKAALECWKKLADPCCHGQLIEFPNSGLEAPLIWQVLSFPISCQWQIRANSYGHVSIFCSIWEWASNLTDTLLDHRFDDYPIGAADSDADHEHEEVLAMTLEHTPAILSRHYFRTLTLVAEILEDLTILRNTMIDDPRAKKNARNDLSTTPLRVDTLIGYVNRICKHKGALHECNHHIPKQFLDGVEDFDPQHYAGWNFLREDCIEIPRFTDIVETVVGAFNKVDELLRDPGNLERVGRTFGRSKDQPDEQPHAETNSGENEETSSSLMP